MELRPTGHMTLVVTTTPTRVYGLEQLNDAVALGYRVIHLASLGFTEPGIDDTWPEGHHSTLLLLGAGNARPRSEKHMDVDDRITIETETPGSTDLTPARMSGPDHAI